MGAWQIKIELTDVRHVVPVNDINEHNAVSYWFADANLNTYPECYCYCLPKREFIPDKNTWMFIHSSFDGREGLEWAQDILDK